MSSLESIINSGITSNDGHFVAGLTLKPIKMNVLGVDVSSLPFDLSEEDFDESVKDRRGQIYESPQLIVGYDDQNRLNVRIETYEDNEPYIVVKHIINAEQAAVLLCNLNKTFGPIYNVDCLPITYTTCLCPTMFM